MDVQELGKQEKPDGNASPHDQVSQPGPGHDPNRLPVLVPAGKPVRNRRKWIGIALVLAVAAAGGGGAYWWKYYHSRLPDGIAFGNGRIESDEVDIDTKFAGRISELRVDIGDMVTTGQLVARMDTRDLQQSLERAQSQTRQAERAIAEATANVEQQQTQQTLATQEMDRAKELLKNGWTTQEVFDQRKQQLDAANAALIAAKARVEENEHARQAAEHDAQLYTVNINDNDLIAPKDGRIQYRVANIGEVLPAGGKVFTMLDFDYVYMDIYLPTMEAGRIKIGSDARIVLDAYPDRAIPAKVSFVASQAQFTPKTVETQTEREKLMFRIRVKIDPERLHEHRDAIRSGLPGLTYVRWDPATAWPDALRGEP